MIIIIINNNICISYFCVYVYLFVCRGRYKCKQYIRTSKKRQFIKQDHHQNKVSLDIFMTLGPISSRIRAENPSKYHEFVLNSFWQLTGMQLFFIKKKPKSYLTFLTKFGQLTILKHFWLFALKMPKKKSMLLQPRSGWTLRRKNKFINAFSKMAKIQ